MERRGPLRLVRAVMRFCSLWAGRRSPQNWDHPLVDHVGNSPSCFFYSHLGNVFSKHSFISAAYSVPDLTDFSFWLHSLLWEGLWSSHGEKMNCKEWRVFQACLKILVTLRKVGYKGRALHNRSCFCVSAAARESVENMEPRLVSSVCLFSPCL